ncbi:MAG: hypothetical protein PVJ38_02430 [Candidatus Bathyarchaeota archaeon]|jgi:hypothetical protein
MIAEYFFQPLQALIPITDTIRTYATVLASASWGLGIAVLTIAHIRAVYQQRVSPHWGYSVIYLVSFAAMALAGLFQGTSGPSFLWGYDHIFAPSHQALYSTTAFFITSAGFRIFRFRNLDSTILLLCGTFVLMSVLPIFTGFIPQLSDIGGWIMNVPGVAGYRAFTIGVALGTIGLGIRIFLHRHPEVLR